MTLVANLAILALAGFVGFTVISKVPNTLHTPLMSGTNAIHGIVLLAGLVLLGRSATDAFDRLLLVVAIAFGAINVVGGFLVTDRMLGMFKKKPSGPRRKGCVRRMNELIAVLYIVAFALFIYGLTGLTGPRTAARGNLIAAVGMTDRDRDHPADSRV